jgi:hypothetical protein
MYSMKIVGIVYVKGETNILWARIGHEVLRVKYVGTGIPEIGDEVLAEGKIVVDPQLGRQFVALGFTPRNLEGRGLFPP